MEPDTARSSNRVSRRPDDTGETRAVDTDAKDNLVVIGEAVKPFGIRGEIKVRPFTESLESFSESSVLTIGEIPYVVRNARAHKGAVLLSLEDIDTPERARELVGGLVKTERKNLPDSDEDEHYWVDLIGMTVVTPEGRILGRVSGMIRTGANDVVEVNGEIGEILLPMIEDVVLDVDTEQAKMVVDPPDGLMPDG